MVINQNGNVSKAMKREQHFIQFALWAAKALLLWLLLLFFTHGVMWFVLLNGDMLASTIDALTGTVIERQVFLQNIEWIAVIASFIVLFCWQATIQLHKGYVERATFLVIFGIGLFILVPRANAELRVIADLGGESAVRFYEPIQPVHTPDAPNHPNAVPATLSEENMLPVVSHQFSVGKVQPRALTLTGAAPMFLIGADDYSRQWLTQNKAKLTSMYAVGLVVNVQTLDELNALRAIVPDLKLLPAPADTLAERLGIHHYPVIINAEGISQ